MSSSLAGTRLPRISVVIPVYNAEKWLAETLGSVLAQNYPRERYEIVVVDDGSEDGSIAVAKAMLAGSAVPHQLIGIGTNAGPSHARNLGWRNGMGSWIQFLDADDLLHPEKMAAQAAAALSLPGEVAVVCSSWQSLGRGREKWVPLGPVESPMVNTDPMGELLRTEGFVPTGSALLRRSWLERVGGYDERFWLIEDVDLMLRIAMAGGQFHRVETEQPLFFYRRGLENSLSQRDRRAFLEGCVRNAELVEGYCRERGELTHTRAQAIISVYFQAARQFAEWDGERFGYLARKLEVLSPGFKPAGPPHLRWISALIGYPKAEKVSVAWRRAKRILSCQSSRHRLRVPGMNP